MNRKKLKNKEIEIIAVPNNLYDLEIQSHLLVLRANADRVIKLIDANYK